MTVAARPIRAHSISPNAWSRPRAAPAPMPPMRWRCAAMSLSVEVRDGAVEESQRSEGDDIGLARACRQRQAVVSTNDIKADVARLAERAVAMARVAPEDRVRRPRRPGAAGARNSPISIWSIPSCPSVAVLEARAQDAPRPPGLRSRASAKSGGASASAGIGGMVLATSHGFRGAYLARATASRWRRSPAKAPRWSATTISPRRCTPPISTRRRRSGAAPASARSRGSIRARSRPGRCRWCSTAASPARSSAISSSAINGSAVARKTSFLRDKLGERFSRRGIRIIDDPLRRAACARGRSTARASPARALALVEDGVLKTWLLDSATARELGTRDHRPRAARRVLVAVARADQPASRSRARSRPRS